MAAQVSSLLGIVAPLMVPESHFNLRRSGGAVAETSPCHPCNRPSQPEAALLCPLFQLLQCLPQCLLRHLNFMEEPLGICPYKPSTSISTG